MVIHAEPSYSHFNSNLLFTNMIFILLHKTNINIKKLLKQNTYLHNLYKLDFNTGYIQEMSMTLAVAIQYGSIVLMESIYDVLVVKRSLGWKQHTRIKCRKLIIDQINIISM